MVFSLSRSLSRLTELHSSSCSYSTRSTNVYMFTYPFTLLFGQKKEVMQKEKYSVQSAHEMIDDIRLVITYRPKGVDKMNKIMKHETRITEPRSHATPRHRESRNPTTLSRKPPRPPHRNIDACRMYSTCMASGTTTTYQPNKTNVLYIVYATMYIYKVHAYVGCVCIYVCLVKYREEIEDEEE